MNKERLLATARVIIQARSVVDALKEISVADLTNAIADREAFQRTERFAEMADERAKAGGSALTDTLKLILQFREAIVAAEPDGAEQAAAAEAALKHFDEHPETQAAKFFQGEPAERGQL